MVHFDLRDGVRMTVMLDEPAALPDAGWEKAQLSAQHGALTIEEVYDGALVRLSFRTEGMP